MKIAQLRILNTKEKHSIERKLNEQFGIKKVPGLLVRRGAERLFLFTGSMKNQEIHKLEHEIPIERLGVYFAKFVHDKNRGETWIKLSIEGVQMMKDQITKNIFELNEEQAERWMGGQDLQIATGKYGFIILKHSEDFLGSGKASAEKIGNYIPKSRRLKPRS